MKVPTIFFGDARSVRKSTKSLVQTGVRRGGWSDVLGSLTWISVLDDDTPIQIADHRVYPSSEKLWRLGYLQPELMYALNDMSLYRKLWLELTNDFWSCLSLIAPHADFGYRPSEPGYSEEIEWKWRQMLLERIVYWMPQLSLVRDRIVIRLARELVYELPSISRELRWAEGIITMMLWQGIAIDRDEIAESWGSDIQSALVSNGIIELHGEHCVLSDRSEFGDSNHAAAL